MAREDSTTNRRGFAVKRECRPGSPRAAAGKTQLGPRSPSAVPEVELFVPHSRHVRFCDW
jgi:hypothetical protein